MTILLVEQKRKTLPFRRAKRGYVLETGKVTMEDDAQSLLHNEENQEGVISASRCLGPL